MIIERDTLGPAGYLAFGGVPDIAFTQNFTSTPIIITNIEGYPKSTDFYTININNVQLNGAAVASSGGSSVEYIIDSGTVFPINPVDMIVDNGDGTCITAWNDGGSSSTQDVYVLGDAFMKNVVSLFDVGAATMQFAGREFYTS